MATIWLLLCHSLVRSVKASAFSKLPIDLNQSLGLCDLASNESVKIVEALMIRNTEP